MSQLLTLDYWIGVSGNLVASALIVIGAWFLKLRKQLRLIYAAHERLHRHIEAATGVAAPEVDHDTAR